MGWLWPFSSHSNTHETQQPSPPPSSPGAGPGASPNVEKQPTSKGFGLTDEQRIRIFGRPGSDQGNNATNISRDAQADAELEAFLNSLESPDKQQQQQQQQQHSSSSSQNTTGSTEHQQSQIPNTVAGPLDPDYDRRLPDGSLDIHPHALLPRTMSCRAAFDQAFYCQSLGGKFNDIYRFGGLQSCSDQWGAFWFCMRTRTLGDREKARQIVEYYKLRDEKKVREKGGSSEDVWDLRETAVQRAFWRDPDEGPGDRALEVEEGKK